MRQVRYSVADNAEEFVQALKAEEGMDIWLMGGDVLFRSMIDAQHVDTIEIEVIPVLLGQGLPLLSPGKETFSLSLADSKAFPRGMLSFRTKFSRAMLDKIYVLRRKKDDFQRDQYSTSIHRGD